MYDYIDTGIVPDPELLKKEPAKTTVKITNVTVEAISDLSEEPEEALRKIEALADAGVSLHIEDMGTIDRTPAGKQLLNAIVSMLE